MSTSVCLWKDYWRLSSFSSEDLAFHKTVAMIVQKEISNVIMENDSYIMFQAIRRETEPPSQIRNLVEDIIVFVKAIEHIKFL